MSNPEITITPRPANYPGETVVMFDSPYGGGFISFRPGKGENGRKVLVAEFFETTSSVIVQPPPKRPSGHSGPRGES